MKEPIKGEKPFQFPLATNIQHPPLRRYQIKIFWMQQHLNQTWLPHGLPAPTAILVKPPLPWWLRNRDPPQKKEEEGSKAKSNRQQYKLKLSLKKKKKVIEGCLYGYTNGMETLRNPTSSLLNMDFISRHNQCIRLPTVWMRYILSLIHIWRCRRRG